MRNLWSRGPFLCMPPKGTMAGAMKAMKAMKASPPVKKKAIKKMAMKPMKRMMFAPPPQGGNGKEADAQLVRPTMIEARSAATQALDLKIEQFKKKVGKMSDLTGDGPKLSMLKDHFSAADMGALWGRLKAARKREDMSISEAWSSLCAMRSGAQKEKNKVLLDMIVLPPGQWVQQLLHHHDEIVSSKTGQLVQREFTRGELEMIHGEREASEMIAKGKWVRNYDEDGDEVFVKAVRSTTTAAGRTQKMTFNRSDPHNNKQKQNPVVVI